MKRAEAIKIRSIIEKLSASLDNKTAFEVPSLFPRLRCDSVQTADTSAVQVGTRICWRGTVKKAKITFWDTEASNPDNAPDMWEDIEYREGYHIIPKTITVTSQFAKGERGWLGDDLYESLYDSNVYTSVQ